MSWMDSMTCLKAANLTQPIFNHVSYQITPHFTTTLLVMSQKSNACFVFVSQVCLCTTSVRMVHAHAIS